MTLPILLGEAPSKQGDRFHHFPLSGRPARVLCEAAGIPPQPDGSTHGRWTWALYEHFECRNLIERYADATPWRVGPARNRAAYVLGDLKRERKVTVGVDPAARAEPVTCELPVVIICLGRRVQAAVGDALDFDVVRRVHLKGEDAWNPGFFGNFGQWAAPWHVRTPFVPADAPARSEPVQEWAPWLVTIPHPSGLNRLLNDPAVRDRLGRVLREAQALAAGTITTVPEL